MKSSSILLISNDEKIANQISDKIKLLRTCDTIRIVSYIEAISVLNSTQPSLMIVYCSNSDSIGIIKEIRTIKSLNKVPIIFVMDNLVEDLLLYAFDNRIDDFFFLSDTDAIILMRILLTLQKSILYKQLETTKDIMVCTNIVDKETGIYTKEQASVVLRTFFSKSIEENLENTVFMYLKPVSISNKKMQMHKIMEIIRSIPRANDIIAVGRNSGFYLILYDAGIKGAKIVSERIKNALSNICQIYSASAEISTSFEQMEPVLVQSVKDQIETGKEFNYLYDLTFQEAVEVMDIRDENNKPFKEFKKEFFESFEKIVAPVFYQQKTVNESKFPEAKIEYSITETESKFLISQNEIISELHMTYPSYVKLLIDIKHFEKDLPPMIRRLTYDFEDVSEETLTAIINDIITEFSNRINMNILQNQLPE